MRLDGRGVTLGSGRDIYTMVALPAVRLAGVAVAGRTGAVDPAAVVMVERAEAKRALGDLDLRIETNGTQADRLNQRSAAIEALVDRYPDDERLLNAAGNVELRLDRLAAAERLLRSCMAGPLCAPLTRAACLYDLACVAARSGRADECRDHLTASITLHDFFRHGIAADPDFVTVIEADWFAELLPPQRPRAPSDVATGGGPPA